MPFYQLLTDIMSTQAYVYWDPVDQTVLAEEQVDPEMRSWRSGAKVEKILLSQWFVKTAAFAEPLMRELNSGNLKEGWRDVIDLQKHWIGTLKGHFCESTIKVTDMLEENEKDKGTAFEPIRIWFSETKSLQNAKYFILSHDHFLANRENAVSEVLDNGVKVLKFTLMNPITGEFLPVVTGPPETMPLVPESSDCRTDEQLSEDFGELSVNESMLNTLSKIELLNNDKSVKTLINHCLLLIIFYP